MGVSENFIGFFIKKEDWEIGEGFFLVFQSGYQETYVSDLEIVKQIVDNLEIGEVYILEYKNEPCPDLVRITHLKSQKIIWER